MDVVVSLALVTLVSLLVLQLFASSSLMARQARQRERARQLAASHLEALKASNFSSLKAGHQSLPPLEESGESYGAELDLTSLEGGQLFLATCQIHWNDGRKIQQVSYSCYVSQH